MRSRGHGQGLAPSLESLQCLVGPFSMGKLTDVIDATTSDGNEMPIEPGPLSRYRVIPFSRFTPQACAAIADRGRAALAVLREWGIGHAINSRLEQAASWLEEVARTGSYGATTTDFDTTLEAIHLCLDFFQVASSLSGKRIDVAARELAITVQGSLLGTASTRQPREYLSQYWLGSLLTLGNLEPRVVGDAHGKRRPDFVVDLSGLDCAIEVKRPASFHSARDALDRAAGQLRDFGLPGAICLDLSDCMWSPGFSTAFLDSPTRIRDQVGFLFDRHAERLSLRPSQYNQSNKYARIFALLSFARVNGWRGRTDPQPEASYLLHLRTYDDACERLIAEYAAQFKRLILTGFERMSGSPVE